MYIHGSEALAKMFGISADAHSNQFDKGGNPYFLHVMTVYNNCIGHPFSPRRIAAVGHDLFEDTTITPAYLVECKFEPRVIQIIDAMTKKKGQSYDDYVAGILADTDAMFVKMSDLQHNSDIRRLKGIGQKDFDRIAKYQTFYYNITERLKYLGEI